MSPRPRRPQPPDELVVLMGDVIAGTLQRLAEGRLRFTYDDTYRRRRDSTPLSLSMALADPVHEHTAVAPWIRGLLPDNPAVLTRWGEQFQAAPTPYALLATPVGEDCAGAVRFVRPVDLARALARPGHVDWLTEDQVAARVRELRVDPTAWLGRALTGQFSLAGAQAKTALLFQDGRWGVPSGATPTSHILKPAIPHLKDHDLNEHLCLDAARRIGLLAARTRVVRFGDETAIVVERYDRAEHADGMERIHQEDLCQALGVEPERKYQIDGGPSPGRITALFRLRMTPTAAADAMNRFADALAWNWVIGGTDAHAKNYSVLLAGGDSRLAPLYDVASLLPYDGVNLEKMRMAMRIGEEYYLTMRPFRRALQKGFDGPWEKAAAELGMDPGRLRARVTEVVAAAPDAFSEAASTPEIVALASSLPARLIDAVAHRAASCARVVATRARAPSSSSSVSPPAGPAKPGEGAGEVEVRPHERHGKPVVGHMRRPPKERAR